MNVRIRAVATLCLFAVAPAQGDEASEIAKLAKQYGLQSEVRMPDETRCDLLSATHAIEVEWAHKWKEAPAQAVLYSLWTGRKPAVVLLSAGREHKLDILRCRLVCERLSIAMRIIDATDD